ncbi:MAG: hypothetical protein R3B70_06000 [Polyangiaceae bacterium]
MAVSSAIRRRVPERLVKAWPTIRAVLVAYHVLAVVVLSFPAPPSGMKRSSWDHPTVQNEFRLWADRLSSVGWKMTPKEFDAMLWSLSGKVVSAREKVIAPFDPYTVYSGARQSWRMFVAPQRYPVRIEVSVREGRGPWRKLYASRSDEHTWRADTFERYRMRRVVFQTAWDAQGRHFKMLCDWIAAQAAKDFPDATELMVEQIRYRTPDPAEALEGKTVLEPKRLAREVRKLAGKK